MAYVPPGALALRSHLEANSPHHRLSSELIAYYKAEAVIGTQRVNLPHGANSKIPHQTSLFPQSPWLAKTCLIFLPHLQPLKSLNDLQQFSSHSKTIPSTQHTHTYTHKGEKVPSETLGITLILVPVIGAPSIKNTSKFKEKAINIMK